jgi:hypothetical protein
MNAKLRAIAMLCALAFSTQIGQAQPVSPFLMKMTEQGAYEDCMETGRTIVFRKYPAPEGWSILRQLCGCLSQRFAEGLLARATSETRRRESLVSTIQNYGPSCFAERGHCTLKRRLVLS